VRIVEDFDRLGFRIALGADGSLIIHDLQASGIWDRREPPPHLMAELEKHAGAIALDRARGDNMKAKSAIVVETLASAVVAALERRVKSGGLPDRWRRRRAELIASLENNNPELRRVLPAEEARQYGERVTDRVVDYLMTLPDRQDAIIEGGGTI
jgi:hypothetical protein